MIARLRAGAAAGRPRARAGRRAAAQRAHAVRPFRRPQLRLGRAGLQPGVVRAALRSRGAGLSSRSEITWDGVIAAARSPASSREWARSSRPRHRPPGTFDRVEQVGRVWIAWLDGKPWADCRVGPTRLDRRSRPRPGSHSGSMPHAADRLTVRETWDPGWTALLDGKPVEIQPKSRRFSEYQNSRRSA